LKIDLVDFPHTRACGLCERQSEARYLQDFGMIKWNDRIFIEIKITSARTAFRGVVGGS
jgi:hypothetical protein